MSAGRGAESVRAAGVLRGVLVVGELEFEEPRPGEFVVVLPGERKQKTTCSLIVGDHSLSINAFVARHPDENLDGVHAWLLERNLRTYVVSFAIDPLGDIYLAGRLPLPAVTPDEIDKVLGAVLEYADGSFNTILELGFRGAITREWAWRTSRGESTANLTAFAHLADPPPPPPG